MLLVPMMLLTYRAIEFYLESRHFIQFFLFNLDTIFLWVVDVK